MLALLLAAEFGIFRAAWFWEARPRTDVGIYRALEEQVRSSPVRPVIILLGDSRLRDAVDARALAAALDLPPGAVLNLALTSGSAWDALLFVRRNPGLFDGVRLVFYQYADWQFNENYPPTNRVRRYATLADRAAYASSTTRGELIAGYFLRMIAARPLTQGYLRQFASTVVRRLQGRDRPEPPLIDPATGRVRYRLDEREVGPDSTDPDRQLAIDYGNFRFSRRSLADLRRLTSAVRRAGARFILLDLPARDVYGQAIAARHAAEHRQCQDSLQAWTRGAAITSWPGWGVKAAAGIVEQDFYDYGHLTLRGGRRYTEWLATRIRAEQLLAAPSVP